MGGWVLVWVGVSVGGWVGAGVGSMKNGLG